MTTRSVDVVIPTYNRLWAIQHVVPHYLTSDTVRRVIVVDDGCTDGTPDWLAASILDARLSVIHHSRRRGACAARNTGGLSSDALYVLFADDDMTLAPGDAMAIMLQNLEQHGGDIVAPAFVSPTLPSRQGNAKGIRDGLCLYNSVTLERLAIGKAVMRTPAHTFRSPLLPGVMLVRRSVLDTVAYDELLGDNSYRDETDFQLKAAARGYRLLACPEVHLIDLPVLGKAGGCHVVNPVRYHLLCCRNNWRILHRHRDVLPEIGAAWPIAVMQGVFIADHLLNRLPRRLLSPWKTKLLAILDHRKDGKSNVSARIS